MWNFNQYADKTAFINDAGEKMTYAELQTAGNDLCSHLQGRTFVFCLCRNSFGSVIGYTAFLQHSIVPVLLSEHLEDDLLIQLISRYRPPYIWLPADLADELPAYTRKFELADYALLRTDYDIVTNLYPELALLLTTSGSTGSPKFVRQSYRNIEANTRSIIQYLELDERQRPITTLPMNYTYGLSIINTHLYVGATVLLTDKALMQKEFWRFFKEYEATSFGGVPYTYEILDKLRFARMDLPSLTSMTQAGGKLSKELHQRMAQIAKEKKIRFYVMYGQSEATARMAYLPAELASEKCGSMGIAIPGGKLYLIDMDGNRINTPYTTGELVYEGENVTLGYAENLSDLAKGDERHGILYTGDMAQKDEDGCFYIVGRKKRFLKIFGNRVNLDEIDMMLKDKFPEIECVSSGKDDHMYLFVTKKEYMEDVKNYIIHKTGLNPAAFQVQYLEQIPKNESGKIIYKSLEQYIV